MTYCDETHVIKSNQPFGKKQTFGSPEKIECICGLKSFSTFETKDDSTQKTQLDEIVIFLKIKVNLKIQAQNNSQNLHTNIDGKIKHCVNQINTTICRTLKRVYFPHDSIEGDSGWL